jgi:hypothetical protein
LRLLATISYLQLHLDIVATISSVSQICNYIAISLQLFWCSSFHVNNIKFVYHLRRTIYVPLVANVTNLIATLWIYKGIFYEFWGILLGVLKFINVYFECIWTTILHVYSSNVININGLNIIVTLISVYFEYIKNLCKIFTKHIVPILQVYPNHLITLL